MVWLANFGYSGIHRWRDYRGDISSDGHDWDVIVLPSVISSEARTELKKRFLVNCRLLMDNKFSKKENVGLWLMTLITLAAVIGLTIHGPLPQVQSYHAFADTRAIWSTPNFFDVISNLAFLLVGLLGLHELFVSKTIKIVKETLLNFTVFFIGVMLVGAGSAYYHLVPSNESLVWDRIPMTIAIMALVSIVLGEFVSLRLGSILLIPLVTLGILSVLFWYWTETIGNGDLRPYVLVQFLPMILIPVILVCFDSVFTRSNRYWLLLTAYVIAKLCEYFDREIYSLVGMVSGHTLKHLIAGAGIYVLLVSFRHRRLV